MTDQRPKIAALVADAFQEEEYFFPKVAAGCRNCRGQRKDGCWIVSRRIVVGDRPAQRPAIADFADHQCYRRDLRAPESSDEFQRSEQPRNGASSPRWSRQCRSPESRAAHRCCRDPQEQAVTLSAVSKPG